MAGKAGRGRTPRIVFNEGARGTPANRRPGALRAVGPPAADLVRVALRAVGPPAADLRSRAREASQDDVLPGDDRAQAEGDRRPADEEEQRVRVAVGHAEQARRVQHEVHARGIDRESRAHHGALRHVPMRRRWRRAATQSAIIAAGHAPPQSTEVHGAVAGAGRARRDRVAAGVQRANGPAEQARVAGKKRGQDRPMWTPAVVAVPGAVRGVVRFLRQRSASERRGHGSGAQHRNEEERRCDQRRDDRGQAAYRGRHAVILRRERAKVEPCHGPFKGRPYRP